MDQVIADYGALIQRRQMQTEFLSAHEKTRLGWRQSETGYPFDYDDDTDPKI
tara:strand:+ start:586 stop:741 length:156 start_codon:yes stop_codon:yes gene_type:complete